MKNETSQAWSAQNTSQRRHPEHLSWLLLMWTSNDSTPFQMSELLSLSLRMSPATLWMKFISTSCCVACDHSWGLEYRLTSKLTSSWSSLALSSMQQMLPQSTCQFPAPIFPHLWTRSQTTWTSPLGAGTLLLLTLFQLRTMATDLEVPSLFPATSHSAAVLVQVEGHFLMGPRGAGYP